MANNPAVPFLIGALVFGIFVGYYGFGGPSITGLAGLSESSGNLSVSVETLIACTFSDDAFSVEFGTVDPGTTGNNATENYNPPPSGQTNYNITVASLSTVNVNVTVKGTNLIDQSNLIGVTNVSWQANATKDSLSMIYASSSLKRLNTEFDQVDKIGVEVVPGDTRFWRMWIDVPSLTVAGNYSGNYTLRCTSFLE